MILAMPEKLVTALVRRDRRILLLFVVCCCVCHCVVVSLYVIKSIRLYNIA